MASDRSDSVSEKIRLLEAAHREGRTDLAMSLAESLKDTLGFERQGEFSEAPLHAGLDAVGEVETLPKSWADWARGWPFFHTVTVFETVGIGRTREPIEVRFAARPGQMEDPWREIRVTRIDPERGVLEEIPSQVLDHVRTRTEDRCEIVFQADVAMHDSAAFLIFFGNPNAELPNYQTDLEVRGEGYGLDIENRYFEAQLSRQMGQLERLRYKREHGLELFAGGKGHGEPPTIDWSTDYADAGHFQKFRIRSWAECPNWEVIRGPVSVRVRRWGFPHGPVHPLFAPSRMHMDQSYSFYAGLPHFFKHGTMEAVKDLEISAMRDDEWVFSGYSFDEILWIDRQGVVHEGKPPADRANDLWGVGFYHSKSRDALMALWLKHEADGFEGIQHNGSPTLHYDGHGQLWSRYPARATALQEGAVFRQRNAYLAIDYPEAGGSEQVARLRHQLMNPLEIRHEDLPDVAAGAETKTYQGPLARPGETPEAGPLKEAIRKVLREVKDEQLYKVESANVVDLGYVYDLKVEDGVARILLTMPHRGRPVYDFLVTGGGGRVDEGIRERVLRVPGIRDVVVDFSWEPTWKVNRVSAACREDLGI